LPDVAEAFEVLDTPAGGNTNIGDLIELVRRKK